MFGVAIMRIRIQHFSHKHDGIFCCPLCLYSNPLSFSAQGKGINQSAGDIILLHVYDRILSVHVAELLIWNITNIFRREMGKISHGYCLSKLHHDMKLICSLRKYNQELTWINELWVLAPPKTWLILGIDNVDTTQDFSHYLPSLRVNLVSPSPAIWMTSVTAYSGSGEFYCSVFGDQIYVLGRISIWKIISLTSVSVFPWVFFLFLNCPGQPLMFCWYQRNIIRVL